MITIWCGFKREFTPCGFNWVFSDDVLHSIDAANDVSIEPPPPPMRNTKLKVVK